MTISMTTLSKCFHRSEFLNFTSVPRQFTAQSFPLVPVVVPGGISVETRGTLTYIMNGNTLKYPKYVKGVKLLYFRRDFVIKRD